MKVSILIASYNSRPWIREAIDSALAQTWGDLEVLVYDDGSTDGSPAIIESYGAKIQAECGTNQGASAARNRLIERATGEWIQLLDGDDYLLPDKIERQMRWLLENDRERVTDLLFSPTYYEEFEESRSLGRERSSLNTPYEPWILLVRNQLPQTGGPLWRRESLREVGAFDPDDVFGLEDLVYLRLLIAGKHAAFCPEIGAVYRIWGNHTLGRRDDLGFCRARLHIIDDAERYLEATGQLDHARRDAIAYGRLDCARSLYPLDKATAIATAKKAKDRHPGYQLSEGASFPHSYRQVYKWLGFEGSERLAAILRRLRRWRGR